MINENFKRMIKAGFNRLGFDLIKRKNSPHLTLLGLRAMPVRTVIDVGANTGQFAKNISSFFPDAKLYCFEPLPEPFAALSAWAKNQNGRVVPFNFALGDKECEVEMFLHEDHTPSSSLLATTKLTEQYYPFTKEQQRVYVKQMTLDAVLDEVLAELPSEILIKLDVQGYEEHVIAGGSNTIRKAAACILEVSLDELYEGQADFRALLMEFDRLGFRYAGNLDQAYGDDGHCIYLDAVFINKKYI